MNKSLEGINYSGVASQWNTYINKADVAINEAEFLIKADYAFYGVYPATDEQVSDFTLRFASLLGDAEVKANGEFTSTSVSREVVLTDADFTLIDALKDQFYLFDGVNANGDIVKRSVLNSNQKFEEGTEGFATDFVLAKDAVITVKDKDGNPISGISVIRGKAGTATVSADGLSITVDGDAHAGYYENTSTKTNGWVAKAATDNQVVVTNLPAKQADKKNGYAAIPGGVMIQLPSSIGTTEPVTIEFELIDVFGVTKTLSVTVKAAK